jgi:hypothetical protein
MKSKASMTKTTIFLFIVLTVMNCSGPAEQAAGATQTGNSISGVLETGSGKPAADMDVYLRSAEYARKPSLAKRGVSPDFSEAVKTDEKGIFVFELAEDDTGALVLEALKNIDNAVRIFISKSDDEPVDLGTQIMTPTGNLQGSVLMPAGGMGSVLVQLLGSTRYAVLGSGESEFEFRNLPAGTYRVRATGLEPEREAVTTVTAVLSGETTANVNITLGDAVPDAGGAIRGMVQLPQGQEGTVAVEVQARLRTLRQGPGPCGPGDLYRPETRLKRK